VTAPKINLSESSPVFGWQEINEVVYLRCPNGHVSRLDHGINEQGFVSPSVGCPKCDFHESNLQLEGYSI
jgi:hypothetical protein